MTKTLYVGDLHVKPNNIVESEALMQFILASAQNCLVDNIVLLGDIFDTHSIVRLEVSEFWDRWFNILSKQPKIKVFILVGNHDLTGSYTNNYSALHPFLSLQNSNFKIIHEPYLDDVYGYLPYIHDDNKFVEEANKLAQQGATVLISHPNYKGAVYDNGTPINNGVDASDLDIRLIHLIGGHIHTELELGRVWYVGTPRWLTKSCANKRKGFWIVDYSPIGEIVSKEFISTDAVCTPIIFLTWKEGDDKPVIPDRGNIAVELIGSSGWVNEQKSDLKGLCSISSKITDAKKSKVRKSGKSLYEFLSEHYKTDKRDRLIAFMKGLNLV